MSYPKDVGEFADDRGLKIVDNVFPFLAIVDEETEYWDTDVGLSVCYDDGDVFVINGVEEDLSRFDDKIVTNSVSTRVDELLDRTDLDDWPSAQKINSRNGLSTPYNEALVLEFDTGDGVKKDLTRATEFVKSVIHSEFIEALYRTLASLPMEYESEPHNSVSPNRRRVGEIEEWNRDFVRITVCDIDDTEGDEDLRLQTVGRILIDAEDVPFVRNVSENPVRLVEASQSDIVGQDTEESYQVGVILSEEWQNNTQTN